MSAPAAHARDTSSTGRERILRAAQALFIARGYAAVSMQQIADAASVNKATLYHHFQDKDALFAAVIRQEFERVRGEIAAELAGRDSLRAQLTRVAARIFATTRSDFGRLFVDLHEHVSERVRAEVKRQCPPPWEILQPAFERALAAGEICAVAPDLAVELFLGMVFAQVRRSWIEPDQPGPDAETAATITDVLLDGIGAGPRGER